MAEYMVHTVGDFSALGNFFTATDDRQTMEQVWVRARMTRHFGDLPLGLGLRGESMDW